MSISFGSKALIEQTTSLSLGNPSDQPIINPKVSPRNGVIQTLGGW